MVNSILRKFTEIIINLHTKYYKSYAPFYWAQ